MDIDQLTLLKQEITSDIEERQNLMSQVRLLHLRYNFSEEDEQVFLNYSIPIIYSVWEGFVQTSFQLYIRELNKLQLNVDNVSKSILIHHLESTFRQFREYPQKAERKKIFFENLKNFYRLNSFNIYSFINTESNVGFDVLNKILEQFNLEKIEEYHFAPKSLKTELDRFLLKIRNNVSHGLCCMNNKEAKRCRILG
jgi:hypothetical protein